MCMLISVFISNTVSCTVASNDNIKYVTWKKHLFYIILYELQYLGNQFYLQFLQVYKLCTKIFKSFSNSLFTFIKLLLIGAVLFKDPEKARQIALLYQRYKKFDQTSYSISNVTFYNLFAAESVRVGR